MIRAVLDTNVLASAAIASTGPISEIVDAWIRFELHIVASTWIFDELVRTLTNPYFTSQLTDDDILNYLRFVQTRSEFVSLDEDEVPIVATHREDDFVLATAVAAGVDYLVTGDRMVRNLESHQGIQILTPREFVDEFRSWSESED